VQAESRLSCIQLGVLRRVHQRLPPEGGVSAAHPAQSTSSTSTRSMSSIIRYVITPTVYNTFSSRAAPW
jgi:hypothetical protein